jgi:hypothetical protein
MLRYGTELNDIQHSDTQIHDTQYKDIQHYDTQHEGFFVTLSIKDAPHIRHSTTKLLLCYILLW